MITLQVVGMLSKRLGSILQRLDCSGRVADIGSDHGLFVRACAEQGSPRPIAVEVARGPYWQSLTQAGQSQEPMDVRFGYGLDPLQPAEVHTVVMAGMGGETIMEILGHSAGKCRSFPLWFFQPMTRHVKLRRYLSKIGFSILDEWIVWEGQRPYLTVQAVPIEQPWPVQLTRWYPDFGEEEYMIVGPGLLLNPTHAVHQFFQHNLQRLKSCFARIPEAHRRIRQTMQQDIFLWEKVIQCHLQYSQWHR